MSHKGQEETLFGHPVGLFTLFFAEMWERFSYYGMRSLLVFYMIKGFLGYNDGKAYGVYGAYTALVYATPFLGGIIADRILGRRQAVILGGALMAAGHLLMGVESSTPFYLALALLVVGNGFFKPNISTMVGSLYPANSERRDAGFTLFYMGINLGAAMSPLICGYVGETYGWHYGFNLATIGMMVGLFIFIFPPWLNMITIGGGALSVAFGLYSIAQTTPQMLINGLIATALVIAASIAVVALSRGGLPAWAGLQPEAAKAKGIGFVLPVYFTVALTVPVIAWLLQGDKLAGYVLSAFGIVATIWIGYNIATREKVERERLLVVTVLLFFSMLFWAFFEQAGSSVNNFTDRNVDRVIETRVLTESDIGTTVDLTLNQGQLGYEIPGYKLLSIDELDELRQRKLEAREEAKTNNTTYQEPAYDVQLTVTADHVGMSVNGEEIPASQFQAANPTFILLFGLVFSSLWTVMARRGIEPSIPVKFGFGLLQLGLGFLAFYIGAQQANDHGMVWLGWLLLGYLLHTTGELCISPVGLSMITKLSPKDIVSALMGVWFLATAFSNYLAAIIAQFTGVEHSAEAVTTTPFVTESVMTFYEKTKYVLGGGFTDGIIPNPIETLAIYSSVFVKIGIGAIIGAVICWMLSPQLVRWTHSDVTDDDDDLPVTHGAVGNDDLTGLDDADPQQQA